MKSTVLVALVLLFALTSQAIVGAAEDASSSPTQVVDTSRKKLRANATSDVVGSLDAHIILSKFKIVEYDDAYKLIYCPRAGAPPPPPPPIRTCKDVGVTVGENHQDMHLAVSDVPLKITFQQA